MFAKLFETDIGQILVKVDDGDSGPEVRFYFTHDGFGVCCTALEFSDNDEGKEEARKVFNETSVDSAIDIAKEAINNYELFFD